MLKVAAGLPYTGQVMAFRENTRQIPQSNPNGRAANTAPTSGSLGPAPAPTPPRAGRFSRSDVLSYALYSA